jgi:NAD+ diphosphatase
MAAWAYCPYCARRLFVDESERERPLRCPTGHFAKYDNPLPAAFGIVRSHDRYLLLRRAHEPKRGDWDVVGGFMQGEESPEECLRREAVEELGLEVRAERLLGAFPSVYGDTGLRVVGIAYLCAIEAGEIRLSDENSEYGWFAFDELPELAFADVRAAFRCLSIEA